jgi:hypothetical protein
LNAALLLALLPGANPGESTRSLHSPTGAGLAGRHPNFPLDTPQQAAGNLSVFRSTTLTADPTFSLPIAKPRHIGVGIRQKLRDFNAPAMKRPICISRLLLCLFVGVLTTEAQPVVTPAPSTSAPPPSLRQAQDTGNQAVPPAEAAAGTLQQTSPFKWGPVTFYPHLFYRFLYGDGIQASPGQQSTTAVHTLSPGVRLDLGTLWTLDYTPTWTFYSNRKFKDTLDHALDLAGGTSYEDWTLQFFQSYNYSNDPLIETGGQTTQQSFSTAFTASYHFGSRMQLDSTISQNLQFTKGLSDSREWSDQERFHYQFSKHLDAFVGLGFGYVKQSKSPDAIYVRPNAGIDCHPTDKISLEASAGVEKRRFRSSNQSDLNSPVFNASVGYQPVATTKLTLAANREVDPSPFAGQITKTTTFSADLNQRLLQNFYLDTSVNHEAVDFVSSVNQTSVERHDKNYSINVKLSTTFLARGTIAIFYQYSNNSSTAAGFAFTSHQGGLEIGYRY